MDEFNLKTILVGLVRLDVVSFVINLFLFESLNKRQTKLEKKKSTNDQ